MIGSHQPIVHKLLWQQRSTSLKERPPPLIWMYWMLVRSHSTFIRRLISSFGQRLFARLSMLRITRRRTHMISLMTQLEFLESNRPWSKLSEIELKRRNYTNEIGYTFVTCLQFEERWVCVLFWCHSGKCCWSIISGRRTESDQEVLQFVHK